MLRLNSMNLKTESIKIRADTLYLPMRSIDKDLPTSEINAAWYEIKIPVERVIAPLHDSVFALNIRDNRQFTKLTRGIK